MSDNSFDAIAKRRLVLRAADGTERDIIARIGRPYWIDEAAGQAACPCAIDGMYPRLVDARGVDLFQALQLALRLVEALLANEPGHSTQVLWPEGQLYEDDARPPFLPAMPCEDHLTHFGEATVRMSWPDPSKEVLVEPRSRTYQPLLVVNGQEHFARAVFVDGPPVLQPNETATVTIGFKDPLEPITEALQPGVTFSIRWAFNTEVGRGTITRRWVEGIEAREADQQGLGER